MGGFGVGGGDEPPRNLGLAGDVGVSSLTWLGLTLKIPASLGSGSEPPAPFLTNSSGKPGWLEVEIFHS